MPLTARDRIAREVTHPPLTELWFALCSLRGVASFMNSGAHPDDEATAMLAILALREGLSVSVACSTRGEGGQNDIGTEATIDLGALRTAEMEQAARRLGLHLYWLSEGPEDSIFDFGFSKSGEETLARWRHDRTLKRFVEIVRTERPDILCPTFLDVPGQHGHHRAMTQLAHEVMDAAADPAFPDVGLPIWTVSKLYLPAWSGGGGSYDDELPPPTATLTIPGKGVEPMTGWAWEHLGQQSRWFHATQGMGHWIAPERERDWSLHLVRSVTNHPDDAITAGLPISLAELGDTPALAAADRLIAETIAAFPDRPRVLAAAGAALGELRKAEPSVGAADRHRVTRKIAQLCRVVRLASGADAVVRLDRDRLRAGEVARVTQEVRSGLAQDVRCELVLPEGWDRQGDGISPGKGVSPSDPYPVEWHPDRPSLPATRLTLTTGEVTSETLVPLETPPLVLPARSLALAPAAAVLNTSLPAREITIGISDLHPAGGAVAAELPAGWVAETGQAGLKIRLPDHVAPDLYEIPLTLDGERAFVAQEIAHPHVDPRVVSRPATLKLRVMPVALPSVRLAYVGGGNDRVAQWLRAIGMEVTELSDAALADDATLAGYDTLLVGLFAMRSRPALRAAMPRIHRWIGAGGHLVTLYHRPRDDWDPETVPPRRLKIGSPSLRWRVTDENAAMTHLVPDHPLLTGPNRIGTEDWEGWHKERGLYFASDWDDAYVPLLEAADPGEKPHRGILLSAGIGKGRHTHCALILHHQLERLTPGAFRLLANLVAPA